MRIPRIYQKIPLAINTLHTLDSEANRHVISALRLNVGDTILLFNGDGYEYKAIITKQKKNILEVHIQDALKKDLESPLKIHLGQVISKGERMEFVIQKATELGVHEITPLFSDRGVVHFKGERLEKKQEHWQKIANAAAEQCGRTYVPKIHPFLPLKEWVSNAKETVKIVLSLTTEQALNDIKKSNSMALLIGPEGGLSKEELEFVQYKNFIPLQLGPRILRTETATLAAITALQIKFGDIQ